ncbi:hypothetical protein EIN_426490 [Entamoeba invadens IP1]|uniref:PiggyBac transposable element-derived protein domain-containing protein n=1 Tax=Entamoeba invadens IP1 TaxID=370355 RepID=A0A0A1U630_ENTIV|nr:hypothetical protein EIN_426490 [Entamoeba invadens IP1]ELP89827.1 hypothetical protein EIN_426490 [Entamoeba invadens IP1]|eukprot:XP_004256598.1 hypothetical protein EIN_426490 [Entamoeba invadens IP1]
MSSGNMTIVKYQCKVNKSVKLVCNFITKYINSTSHNNKPQMIMLYNTHKVGVDRYDQLIHYNDVSRRSNRFTLSCFYDIINCAVTNAYILFNNTHQHSTHKNFVESLSNQIVGSIPPGPNCLMLFVLSRWSNKEFFEGLL